MTVQDKIKLGSKTAKGGFKNEKNIIDRFNNWKNDPLAQKWLEAMNYNLKEIESVKAVKIKGSYKADIQVQIQIGGKIEHQNLQVKLVSNSSGFNQIDKRWVRNYAELWNIDQEIEKLLKHFTGEIFPYVKNTRDPRRMFIDEFTEKDQEKILSFFKTNKDLILADILKGRGKLAAEWFLVIQKNAKNEEIKWNLKPINFVLNYYGNGEVKITPRGSIKIGKIGIQRKGGDNGRPTANMLQFKVDPTELIN